MKPKTKLQIRVKMLSETKLPKLTQEQKDYAYKHVLDHLAVRNKGGRITCLDCAYIWHSKTKQGWQDEILPTECPSCKTKLKITQSQKRKFDDWGYFGIIDTCEEYQVVRTIKITGYYHSGKKAELFATPVSEIWKAPNNKYEIIGFNHANNWSRYGWTGDWQLKSRNHLNSHIINPFKIWPKINVLKKVKRNGFKSSFYKIAPYRVIHALLTDSKAETLLKAKQISAFKHHVDQRQYSGTYKYWSEIKMAMRNNYIIKDFQIWRDYIKFCKALHYNLADPKIVCPEDCHSEHNRLMHLYRIQEEREQVIREANDKILQAQLKLKKKQHFENTKKWFRSLNITNGKISIVGFTSEKQVKEEGVKLDHCIHINKYYLNLNKALLSARYNGEVVETIEIDLREMKVLACRGYDNLNSKHHKAILKLMNKNFKVINECMNPKKKKRKTKRLEIAA